MKKTAQRAVRNPLRTRVFKEIIGEWKKYAVIFVFLTAMIGFVSGMYVANNSMLIATERIKTEQIREDGHFELDSKATAKLRKGIASGKKYDVRPGFIFEAYEDVSLEDLRGISDPDEYIRRMNEKLDKAAEKAEEDYENAVGEFELDDPFFHRTPVRLFENFCKNADEDIDGNGTRDSGIRVYKNRDDIDLYSVMDGRPAEKDSEIMIDRMHADNRGIKVGDKININGEEFEVCGLAAFSNYSTLHEKSTDMMFDALTFDVAMTTEEGWDRIKAETKYEYAWLYREKPADVIAEKKLADNFMKALITQAAFNDNEVKDFVPEYTNPAINFAPDDFGSDKAMGGVILDILIVVLAFIFAITVSNTISREAPVIGTLRASGYTRGELTLHYMTAPVLVTLMGALAGNILGYTYFKNVVVAMYYNSYSLPQYETVWTPDAFVKTTVIPVIMMLVINWLIISRKLRFSPLRFLRGDLRTIRRRKAVRLPDISFIKRFRIRIFLQNFSGYLMLFIGIGFVMIMLAMAVGMPSTLDWYQEHAEELMVAKQQVVLTSDHDEDGEEIMTSVEGAEKFSMEDMIAEINGNEENISIYGMEPGNRYVDVPEGLGKKDTVISSAFHKKFGIEIGDTINVRQKYGFKKYDFKVAGIVEYDSAVAAFMDNDCFNEAFDRDKGSFDGFYSDREITDIDKDYIAATITADDILKMAAQLNHSMGAYMLYFQYLCVLLAAVLIFLLTKVIVERNEKSISMVKILGYSDKEIASLYLVTTTFVVILSEIATAFLATLAMSEIWKLMLKRMDGYFPFVMEQQGIVKMLVLVFAGYLLVMVIDFRRIRRIPMDEALKNAE